MAFEKGGPTGRQKFAGRSREALEEAFRSLSPRERQVLEFLRQGFLTKEIAYRLELSPRTIEDYRASLKRKMGARTLVELADLVASLDYPAPGPDDGLGL